ncbi:short-chain dehydrogenase [Sulfitobacter sp. SK012]|uniref:oxidoreductase n=1 Tax=Sulfitobacter sp. SK012 TaxID=1389005 RepID=UPI000E0B8766|nr:oxidoreductase [Sulfitobacter sp. SK012]AXI46290.1 short-chain dehydrogenase [Sulfitobacter sp. SK012]
MISEFQHWIDQNLPSQKGKTILITGGNSGIGYYSALALAKAGAHVVIAGRNPSKIDQAIKSIEAEGVDGSLKAGIVDLASLESVRQYAAQFVVDHSKLDILINNAGVMMPPEGKTEEGFESQFGVNYLSHFALTGLLFDRLQSTTGSRVVTLSSIAHRGAQIDFDNLRLEKPYDQKREYYQSKLANLLFALEFGRRIDAIEASVLSVACHPGFTKTELQRHVDPAILEKMTFMDAWQGSLPTLVAATGHNVIQGDYFGPDGPGELGGFPAIGEIDASAMDTHVANRLWDVGQDVTGVAYP